VLFRYRKIQFCRRQIGLNFSQFSEGCIADLADTHLFGITETWSTRNTIPLLNFVMLPLTEKAHEITCAKSTCVFHTCVHT